MVAHCRKGKEGSLAEDFAEIRTCRGGTEWYFGLSLAVILPPLPVEIVESQSVEIVELDPVVTSLARNLSLLRDTAKSLLARMRQIGLLVSPDIPQERLAWPYSYADMACLMQACLHPLAGNALLKR
jgi:hypothetical protein